jgi:hypothetical protein
MNAEYLAYAYEAPGYNVQIEMESYWSDSLSFG